MRGPSRSPKSASCRPGPCRVAALRTALALLLCVGTGPAPAEGKFGFYAKKEAKRQKDPKKTTRQVLIPENVNVVTAAMPPPQKHGTNLMTTDLSDSTLETLRQLSQPTEKLIEFFFSPPPALPPAPASEKDETWKYGFSPKEVMTHERKIVQNQQKAAILYFMLTNSFSEKDFADRDALDRWNNATTKEQKKRRSKNPPVDPCPGMPKGERCINPSKLMDFLFKKFIPGRSYLQDEHWSYGKEVGEGHIMDHDDIEQLAKHPLSLLADWVAYIMGRPRPAVPKPVRDLLRPGSMRDDMWPGSVLPRSVFMPPDKKGYDGKGVYVDQDITPFQLQNKASVIAALKILNETNPFEELGNLVVMTNVEDEEFRLAYKTGMKDVINISLVSVSLMIPLTIVWFIYRALSASASADPHTSMKLARNQRGLLGEIGTILLGLDFGPRNKLGPYIPAQERGELPVEGFTSIDQDSVFARRDAVGLVGGVGAAVQGDGLDAAGFGRLWQTFSNKGLKNPTQVGEMGPGKYRLPHRVEHTPSPLHAGSSSYLGQALPRPSAMPESNPVGFLGSSAGRSGGVGLGGGGFGGPSNVPDFAGPGPGSGSGAGSGAGGGGGGGYGFEEMMQARMGASTAGTGYRPPNNYYDGSAAPMPAQGVETFAKAPYQGRFPENTFAQTFAQIGLVNPVGAAAQPAANPRDRLAALEAENARLKQVESEQRRTLRMDSLTKENDKLKILKSRQLKMAFADATAGLQ